MLVASYFGLLFLFLFVTNVPHLCKILIIIEETVCVCVGEGVDWNSVLSVQYFHKSKIVFKRSIKK